MTTASSPPLVEYLDDYLRRRRRSGLPLTPGEAVTLAVELVRGYRRAEENHAQGSAWALTARGCPVLVDEIDGDDPRGATTAALSQLAGMLDDDGRERVDGVRDALFPVPPPPGELERRLFAWADPMPLVLGPLSPRIDEADEASRAAAQPPPLLAAIDGDLAAAAMEAVREVRQRWSRWRHARAFSFALIAVGTVAVVGVAVPMTVPLTQPAAEATPSTITPSVARTPDAEPPATPLPSGRPTVLDPGGPTPLLSDPTPMPSVTETSSSGDTVVETARALLIAYATCAGDPTCEQNVREGRADPDETPPKNPADARISLVDDFGGLAVVRVDDGDESRYVTLVREKDRWLVRAVRTVADQPS